MTTPRPHCELIKVWADGKQIQRLDFDKEWIDSDNPTWAKNTTYRVKPREFKDGAFYPVITSDGKKDVVQHFSDDGEFYLCGSYEGMRASVFVWVGEELPESLWNQS